LLGIPTESVALDLVNDVIFKARSAGNLRRRMYDTWEQMTALLKAGRLNLEALFDERISLDKFESAFVKLQSGLAGKYFCTPTACSINRKFLAVGQLEFFTYCVAIQKFKLSHHQIRELRT